MGDDVGCVIRAIKAMPIREQYRVHMAVGDMIKRRMFYQLTICVPWARSLDKKIMLDPTDDFLEVCDSVAQMIGDAINYTGADMSKLPPHIFTNGEIKVEHRNEETFFNIIKNVLNDRVSYDIQQWEMSF